MNEVFFREHRGSHVESLKTLIELPDTWEALLAHLRMLAEPWPTMPPITLQTVHVVPYYAGRQLVTLDGYGVLGYLELERPLQRPYGGDEP
jgi:hypothetical protein